MESEIELWGILTKDGAPSTGRATQALKYSGRSQELPRKFLLLWTIWFEGAWYSSSRSYIPSQRGLRRGENEERRNCAVVPSQVALIQWIPVLLHKTSRLLLEIKLECNFHLESRTRLPSYSTSLARKSGILLPPPRRYFARRKEHWADRGQAEGGTGATDQEGGGVNQISGDPTNHEREAADWGGEYFAPSSPLPRAAHHTADRPFSHFPPTQA